MTYRAHDDLALLSGMPGVAWPSIPPPDGAAVLAMLQQLERSQWWPAERLLELQLGQLREVLFHAHAACPLYTERLRLAGIDPRQPLTLEALRAIPPLTRAELRDQFEAIRSRALPREHGPPREVFTSGSTGAPIRALTTMATDIGGRAMLLREHAWHRRDLMARLAMIRRIEQALFPTGARTDSWTAATRDLLATGPCLQLDIRTPVADQVDWLLRTRPDYLVSNASNLHALANHCLRAGVRLPELRQAMSLGEALRPDARLLCRQAWGVELADIYSAEEVGSIALQCPEHEHYHLCAETLLVEVIDDAGAPCAPGQVGRVLISSLLNFATPLIRYEIGDLAEVGPACTCGRTLPVLARILGRYRDALTLPDGTRLLPSLTGLARRVLAIRQFQLVRAGAETLVMRFIADRALTEEEQATLTAELRDRFRHDFVVQFEPVASIERESSGKFRDFISLVD